MLERAICPVHYTITTLKKVNTPEFTRIFKIHTCDIGFQHLEFTFIYQQLIKLLLSLVLWALDCQYMIAVHMGLHTINVYHQESCSLQIYMTKFVGDLRQIGVFTNYR